VAYAEMPLPLVEAAERVDLPLIALHQEIPFVAVTEAMHTEIVSSHYALLRRGEEIQRELSGRMLDGEGIPEVLTALAATLAAPVFLEASGGLLARAVPPGYELDPIEVWQAARRSVDGVTVHEAKVRMGNDQAGGRLLVADLQPSAAALASIALEHAAGIVALALLRERQEEELVARERGSFLANLADGRIAARAVAKEAQAAGLERPPKWLLPIAAEIRAGVALAPSEWVAALREARRLMSDRGLQAVLGRRGTSASVLAVVALRDVEQRASAADDAAHALRRALRDRMGADSVTIAIGRAQPPEQSATELRLTEESAASATALHERPWHDIAALELNRLLWARRNDPDLAGFVERSLGPLFEHDRQRKRALLPTLEALLENGGHKAQTARALHLNRQALYDRLTRLEELLGADLSDSQQMLTLHVALHARRYLDGLG
jgi:purine catabolism regulator